MIYAISICQWIAPAALMYVMDSLIKQIDSPLKRLSNEFDFWFVPSVNPDGYVYSYQFDRLWRKTKSKNQVCDGVDPNRNYDFHWRESGASLDECDETYAGNKAASEPEVRLMSDLLDKNASRIAMYFTLHSYSQMIIFPFGYGRTLAKNDKELRSVAMAGAKAYASVRGTHMRIGTSASILYPAAGGSDDYAMGHSGIEYAYTMELPDRGRYGFLLPPSEIVPVGKEVGQAMSKMIEKMQELKGRPMNA